MTILEFDWTDESEAKLIELWNSGLSASVCAAKLGGNLTRNAVMGKIHRLRRAGVKLREIARRPVLNVRSHK